jgi:molybdopterin synthase sulfur carrier subunit
MLSARMLSVTVRYFARLRELRGLASEKVPITADTTAVELYEQLFPVELGERVSVGFAVNKIMVSGGTLLSGGDEVAFIPPVGGG